MSETMTPAPGYSGALLAMLADSPTRRANAVLDVAKLMRQRADAATQGTWGTSSTEILAGINRSPSRGYVDYDHRVAEVFELGRGSLGGSPDDAAGDADALHIATMANPAVARALANWLEGCVDRFCGGGDTDVSAHAVSVCEAYLSADVEG